MIAAQSQRNPCGQGCAIAWTLSLLLLGSIDSLALSSRWHHPAHSTITAVTGDVHRKKMRLDMQPDNKERNVEVRNGSDSKYDFVHPSIRNVLLMEPRDIPLDFFESECMESRNRDKLLLNTDTYTIEWDVLDDLMKNTISKPNAHKSQHNTTIPMEYLVKLASQCDLVLFRDCKAAPPSVPYPIRGLLRMLPEGYRSEQKDAIDEEDDAYFYIATLLALNMVENSIRHLIGKRNGRAPLLKDMIEIMATRSGEKILPESMISVTRTLLLPTNGLNLRNLLWHGFLPAIPRRWFSLSVVLVLSLDELAGSSSFELSPFEGTPKPTAAIAAMRNHQTLVAVLDHGKGILSSPKELKSLEEKITGSNIVPKSHRRLLRVALGFVHQPIMFASVAGPLIEHLLRLMWCDQNKQNKRIAEPGSYYVTLDGHGQKNKHEVVVMPFFFDQEGVENGVRNKLVYRLGGSTMAFLMDMFTSPAGGPNIRATIAHGSFNRFLFDELIAIDEGIHSNGDIADELKDMTSALLSVLSILCEDGRYATSKTGAKRVSTILGPYRPCFSYASLLVAEAQKLINSMEAFYDFLHGGRHLRYSKNACRGQMQIELTQKVAAMSPSFDLIVTMQARICKKFGVSETRFADESFFRESSNNLIASECGAAKLLLSEISEATFSTLRDLNDGITVFENDKTDLSSRRRKQISRECATAQLAFDFYSIAAYCAFSFIDRRQDAFYLRKNRETRKQTDQTPTDDELFVAVKRSRMVVSTFSTTKALDRALKALSQYTAGKAVKAVSASVQNSDIQRQNLESRQIHEQS